MLRVVKSSMYVMGTTKVTSERSEELTCNVAICLDHALQDRVTPQELSSKRGNVGTLW